MVKCGILTFHNVPNYGAALQAFALCKYIRETGFECEIIDYSCKSIDIKERKFPQSSNPAINMSRYLFSWRSIQKRIKGHDEFMQCSGLVSKECYNSETIHNSNKLYNVFITGSDQVWNLTLTGNDKTYFLNFCEPEKIKLAYAASAGGSMDSGIDDKEISSLIKEYSWIGLREEQELVRKVNDHSCVVSDPTMLLLPDFYLDIAELPSANDYVLIYYPDDMLVSAAEKYSRIHKKEIIIIATGRQYLKYKRIFPKSPNEWIGWIHKADAVFTNSYHGLLFSLYLNKRVWTAYKGNKSKRQDYVIRRFGIENCYVWNDPEMDYTPEYKTIVETMNKFRNESRFVLDSALQEASKKLQT